MLLLLSIIILGIFIFLILCWEFIKFIAIPVLIIFALGFFSGFLK